MSLDKRKRSDFSETTAELWLLFKSETGRYAIGRGTKIASPSLPVRIEEGITTITSLINNKIAVTLSSGILDEWGREASRKALIMGYANTQAEIENCYSELKAHVQKLQALHSTPIKPNPRARKALSFSRKPSLMDESDISRLLDRTEETSQSIAETSNSEDSCDSPPPAKTPRSNKAQLSSNNTITMSTLELSGDSGMEIRPSSPLIHQQPETGGTVKRDNPIEQLQHNQAAADQDSSNNPETLIAELRRKISELESNSPSAAEERLISRIITSVEERATRTPQAVVISASTLNASRGTQEPPKQTEMIRLIQGYSLMINKEDLKLALAEAKKSPLIAAVNAMANKILESVYSRQFMSERSLTGRKPPKKKTSTPVKPIKLGLPKEDVEAITLYMVAAWKKFHGQVLEKIKVRQAIGIKLSTEHRAFKAALAESTDSGNGEEDLLTIPEETE